MDIQAQGFVPAALADEVGCIQSYVLVQDFIVLEDAHREQQHESREVNTCHAAGTDIAHTQQTWSVTRAPLDTSAG